MALTLSNLGSTQNKTSEASTSISSLTASVGDMLIVAIAADNAGTSGVSAISSVTDSVGNTYLQKSLVNRTSGAANDGCTHAIYTCILASALSAGSVTVNFSPNVTAKAVEITRVQPGAGETITYRDAGAGVSGTGTSSTITASSTANGDTVFGAIAMENNVAFTGDSDTTNGSWSTMDQIGTSGGAAGANIRCGVQWKTVNATGDQTWNISWSSSRPYAGNWIRIYPATPKTITADAGSYAITGTAASLEYGREVVAAAGSYVLTGTAADLEYGREVAAGAGSYTVSGTDASLEYGREVVAAAGAYALSGTDAALEYGREIVAGAGSYAFTGTDAELTYTPAVQETLGGSWYPRPIKYVRDVPYKVQEEPPPPIEVPFTNEEFAAIARGLIADDVAALIRQIQDAALTAEAQLAAREAGQRYIEHMQRDEDDAMLALLLSA